MQLRALPPQQLARYSATVRALVDSLSSTSTSTSRRLRPLPPVPNASSSSSSSLSSLLQLSSTLWRRDDEFPRWQPAQGQGPRADSAADDDASSPLRLLPPWLEYFEHLGGWQQQRHHQQDHQPQASAIGGGGGGVNFDDDHPLLLAPDGCAGHSWDDPAPDDESLSISHAWEYDNIVVDGDPAGIASRHDGATTTTTTTRATTTTRKGAGSAGADSERDDLGAMRRAAAAGDGRTARDDEDSRPSDSAAEAADANASCSASLPRVERLEIAVRSNDPRAAVRAFEDLERLLVRDERRGRAAASANTALTIDDDEGGVPLYVLQRLSMLLSYQKDPPIVAHRVLQRYQREHAKQQKQQQQQQQQQEQHADTAGEPRHEEDDSSVDDGSCEGSTTSYPSAPRGVDAGLINSMVGWYKSVCFNVRHFDPRRHSDHDIQSLVRKLLADVAHLTMEHKRDVYPILISSLVAQRSVRVGRLAYPVFESLLEIVSNENDGDSGNGEEEGGQPPPLMSAPFLEHLLGHAKFHRQQDLPYPRILEMLARQRRPYPAHAVAVLENLFPFDDLDDTATALRALVELQSSSASSSQPRTPSSTASEDVPAPDSPKDAVRDAFRYVVDISTLEAIGASAARVGSVELSMLVWDAVHVMGHRAPTPAIYENLVLVFCAHPRHYASAFTVLAEMQERGYTAHRALIRSMSTHLREYTGNLDSALAALKELRLNGLHISAAMLNAIMSGAAERGDIDRTLSLLEEFGRNGAAPDADSYSFAMEALGKHLSRRTRTPAGQHFKDQCLDTASSLLSRMEEEGILPTHHIIRDYVELLCRTGQVGVATDIVLESMELKTTDSEVGAMPLVGDKTIYRVAMANVKMKEFEVARRVAACSAEPLPFLWRAIEAHELGAPFVDKYMEG